MNTSAVQTLFAQHVLGNYARTPVAVARGEGAYIWDAEGKRYLDLLSGLGVNGLGHCPPRVVEAVRVQAGKLLHIHNVYMWEQQGLLAQALAGKLTGMDAAKAFFCNSGTEATEAGLKLARLHGKQKGGKWKIISTLNSFHGRTYGSLSATGQTNLHKNLEPMLPGFSYVPLNDVAALERAFDAETAGFVVEPVQGEGGIFICQPEFLRAARKLCDQHGALLMYDEVQSGVGRTGDFFAYQTLSAPAPDVIWIAKALGGGFPIGAMLARSEVAQAMVPGTHGSTFGGNPLACAAALAVIETIEQDNLLAHVRDVAAHLAAGLARLKDTYPSKIQEIRQLGLMAGIELKFPGKTVNAACLDRGLMVNVTHETTLRLLPPLIVTKSQLDEGLAVIAEVLQG